MRCASCGRETRVCRCPGPPLGSHPHRCEHCNADLDEQRRRERAKAERPIDGIPYKAEHEHAFSYSHSAGVTDGVGTNLRIEHIVICKNCGDLRRSSMLTFIDGVPYEKYREKMETLIQENELLRLAIMRLEDQVQEQGRHHKRVASTSCNCGTSEAPCPYHPVAKNTGPEC